MFFRGVCVIFESLKYVKCKIKGSFHLKMNVCLKLVIYVQTQFHKSWDTVQIVNKNRMQ